MRGTSLRTVRYGLLLFLMCVILFYAKFQPLRFHLTEAGLDPSWQATLAFATEQRWRFGTDIVFTGGPLSSLYSRQYVGAYTYAVAVLSILVLLHLAVSTATVFRDGASPYSAALRFILLSVCLIYFDTFFLMMPLVTALVFINGGGRNLWRNAHSAVGSLLCGILCLAKFSIFPLSLITVIILDVLTIRRKAVPVQTVMLFIGTIVGFTISGQQIDHLPSFFISSLEVSSGYSSAMSLPGRFAEVSAWLMLSATFVFALVRQSYIGSGSKDPLADGAKVIVTAAYLFIAWKAGFVRHDLHSLIAWSSLSVAVILAGFMSLKPFKPAWCGIATLAVLTIIPPYVLVYKFKFPLPLAVAEETAQVVSRGITDTISLIIEPTTWQKQLEERRQISLSEIRLKQPLPKLEGTVDIIQSEQSDLIANGLHFTPRPTIQEYTSYSTKLIARNHAFFEGNRAPDYLFMAPGSIDGRHPASAEGSLWPLFFASYSPDSDLGRNLLLKKRTMPIAGVEGQVVRVEAKMGEKIPLPNQPGPMMLSVKMHPTVLGRLLDLLYRPPLTALIVTYEDGSETAYRIIPAMAAEGFLISPLVSTPSDYLIVSTGHSQEAHLQTAKSVAVGESASVRLAFQSDINVEFTPLNNDALKRADSGALVSQKLTELKRLELLVANNPLNGQTLAAVPEGILAHAPSKLSIPVVSGANLKLAFGMRAGSWKDGGQTDGVCFVATAVTSTLMQKCLDPVKNSDDRIEQAQIIAIPEGVSTIELRTDCGKTCTWDWSYWSEVSLEK
ncbi:hypothetical protein [Rhizobium sp. B21/90]|uniref:hypothetical protein n=1 Tax=Rhizobium sp. B21/90 TaxID=2819993 RepID=UPI001C5A65DC|nr:hypothetical protein [Rhizobium sp. B21/90]QYA03980.1 hypothetical protein J5278_24790 [Rhizobium sp. B21/90]